MLATAPPKATGCTPTRSLSLAAAIGCLTLAFSTSPSSAQIRIMLCDEVSSGYIETEKKSGVLSTLFEHAMQYSCPSIYLEALQVIVLAWIGELFVP
ncbi:unnamed protein product [Sphenostylis stenocarpa]|uniref:Uncharacterized protein n=1 Tax=Sphenostylis stenocarpa TaxID=92480 RepID=A0AA87BCR8_9FABA|nr:unnamed protein product [Sphenostylis stenocarpa]